MFFVVLAWKQGSFFFFFSIVSSFVYYVNSFVPFAYIYF